MFTFLFLIWTLIRCFQKTTVIKDNTKSSLSPNITTTDSSTNTDSSSSNCTFRSLGLSSNTLSNLRDDSVDNSYSGDSRFSVTSISSSSCYVTPRMTSQRSMESRASVTSTISEPSRRDSEFFSILPQSGCDDNSIKSIYYQQVLFEGPEFDNQNRSITGKGRSNRIMSGRKPRKWFMKTSDRKNFSGRHAIF